MLQLCSSLRGSLCKHPPCSWRDQVSLDQQRVSVPLVAGRTVSQGLRVVLRIATALCRQVSSEEEEMACLGWKNQKCMKIDTDALTRHREEPSCSYGEGDRLFLVAFPFQAERRHGEAPQGWQVKGCSRWAREPLCFLVVSCAFSWCPALSSVPLSPCQQRQARRYHPHPWHASAGLPTWARSCQDLLETCDLQGCPYPADGSAAGHVPPRD